MNEKKPPSQGGAAKKTGKTGAVLTFTAIEIKQTSHHLYLFAAPASQLFEALSINRRIENKDEGYQRVLSPSRVQAITRFIASEKRAIPGAIIVSIDAGDFDKKTRQFKIPKGTDVGWVIDGQHRLAGADQAARQGTDIDLPVVAFCGLTEQAQIEQFVTINREAKNVPTSLYLDLLKRLPGKKPADAARERAVDIANELRKDEGSPFFNRVVVTSSPRQGEVSLVNFVRKISPLVTQDKGILGVYTEREQSAVIRNYFEGFRQVFSKEFNSKDGQFFKTVGFGALWNVFPTFFSLVLKLQSGFDPKDVVSILKKIENFDFSSWKQYGTGNQAENLAGNDLRTTLLLAFNQGEASGSLRV